MQHARHRTAAIAAAAAVTISGILIAAPIVFAGRVYPGAAAANINFTGVAADDVPTVLGTLDEQITNQQVTLELRGHQSTLQLNQLGVELHRPAITRALLDINVLDVLRGQHQVEPYARTNRHNLKEKTDREFAQVVASPVNASLELTPAGNFITVPSQSGEVIDIDQLARDLEEAVKQKKRDVIIQLSVLSVPAQVQDHEVQDAQEYARQLLANGLELQFADQSITMNPATIRRLLTFVEHVDPNQHDNHILGVKFDHQELAAYLDQTVAPQINQQPRNARFERTEERVVQFATPQDGQVLDTARTASHIAAKLAKHELQAPLAVDVTKPDIAQSSDIEKFGVTDLLAVGASDYVGSPQNRQHNIAVGAARYHGLLISPGQEFSFNEFLGPVDASAGFLPELVIKSNVTTPEYGGGLCQVSTTVFRAALNAGLEITQRRNHSYPVRYYGAPGLDATIYPPYTDLRFLNNTPGYILIQTRIEGTKLAFEFWGTSDGRQVELAGPVSYDRQPDGAVKAHVSQKVTKGGEVIIDDTFYSRYKSPKLFPTVLAANGEAPPEPTPKPEEKKPDPVTNNATATPQPKADEKPAPTPKPTGQPSPSVAPAGET